MAYTHKPNTGSLFPNQKKSDNSPDMTGTFVDANGKEMRIAAWVKQGAKGQFYSVQVSEKTAPSKDNLPF